MIQRADPKPSDLWICDACHEPIPYLHGIIMVDDRRSIEMPEYDPDAPRDTVALDDYGKVLPNETAHLQVQAAKDMISDPGVQFNVYHLQHAPPTHGGVYLIPTHRAHRLEQWVAWISHLEEKNWMKRIDFVRAIRFWCTGHGIAIPDDLT